MIISWLKSLLCDKYISPPKGLEKISKEEVFSIVNAEFPKGTKFISDANYKTISKEEMMRFLKEDITDKYLYVSEYYDCDDFSFKLMGEVSNPDWGCLPFGIIWVKEPVDTYHALNCFIDKNREMWIIEPQNDRIYKCPKSWVCVMMVI